LPPKLSVLSNSVPSNKTNNWSSPALRPKAGPGSSVAFLKGIDGRFGVIKKGFYVARLLIRCASRQ
jgi:hypothetical protein